MQRRLISKSTSPFLALPSRPCPSFPFLSLSFPSFPFLSLSFPSFPFLSLPFLSFPVPSVPFLSLPLPSFPFLSLPFPSFPFLSLPFPSFPFLSLLFPSFPFLSLAPTPSAHHRSKQLAPHAVNQLNENPSFEGAFGKATPFNKLDTKNVHAKREPKKANHPTPCLHLFPSPTLCIYFID